MNGNGKDTMTDLNWTQVKRAAEENAVVLMPLGVIEEHGPHLCLGTDIYTAHEYCRPRGTWALPRSLNRWRWRRI